MPSIHFHGPLYNYGPYYTGGPGYMYLNVPNPHCGSYIPAYSGLNPGAQQGSWQYANPYAQAASQMGQQPAPGCYQGYANAPQNYQGYAQAPSVPHAPNSFNPAISSPMYSVAPSPNGYAQGNNQPANSYPAQPMSQPPTGYAQGNNQQSKSYPMQPITQTPMPQTVKNPANTNGIQTINPTPFGAPQSVRSLPVSRSGPSLTPMVPTLPQSKEPPMSNPLPRIQTSTSDYYGGDTPAFVNTLRNPRGR